jgi:hypothetical protein
MATKPKVTLEDLYHVPEHGKAEIVHGALTLMAPTGFLPHRASFNIAASLRDYERRTKAGFAFADNALKKWILGFLHILKLFRRVYDDIRTQSVGALTHHIG